MPRGAERSRMQVIGKRKSETEAEKNQSRTNKGRGVNVGVQAQGGVVLAQGRDSRRQGFIQS